MAQEITKTEFKAPICGVTTKRALARKFTNKHISMAQTKTLSKVLFALNHHYSKTVNRSREELIALVKRNRDNIVWGVYSVYHPNYINNSLTK